MTDFISSALTTINGSGIAIIVATAVLIVIVSKRQSATSRYAKWLEVQLAHLAVQYGALKKQHETLKSGPPTQEHGTSKQESQTQKQLTLDLDTTKD